LPYSNITFYATSIKLYFTPITQIKGIKVKTTNKEAIKELIKELTKEIIDIKLASELIPLLIKRSKGQLRKNPHIIIFLQNNT